MTSRARMALVTVVLTAALPATATDHGIFVDGSYSPNRDSDSEIDRLIDRRLAEADGVMRGRNPSSVRETVDTKEELRQALEGIECRCGDTITVMLMGHGRRDKFVFSKARRNADRYLEAAELARWLEAAAKECCCKIQVVIFSCHSGSFLDELFAAEHVESVYASCADDEKSYSDAHWLQAGGIHDGGDWLKGFNEDWRQVGRQLSPGDALQAASESARENVPFRYMADQHPRGWRRGELPVVAHVDDRERRGKLDVHLYRPEFVRSSEVEIDVSEVERPDDLDECHWIGFTGRFGAPDEPITPTGGVTRTDAPRETVLAHVVGKKGKKKKRRYIMVHTVRPRWQYCHKQRLFFDELEQIPEGLRACNWLRQNVTIEDPEEALHTGDRLNRTTPTFPAKVHVSGSLNQQTGRFTGTVHFPKWLKDQRVTIELPENERAKLGELRSCDLVLLDLEMSSGEDRPLRGSDLKLVHRRRGSWRSRYDAAVHPPGSVFYDVPSGAVGDERLVSPVAYVVNLGSETVDVPVRAVIALAEEEGYQEEALHDPSLAGVLWSAEGVAEGLEPAATATVRFEPWQPPSDGGTFFFGLRTMLPGDENSTGNTAWTEFRVTPAEPEPSPPEREEATTGNVLDLGELAADIYKLPVTAKNISCAGKHTFELSFEQQSGADVTWFRFTGPTTLEKIPIGGEKVTWAALDLTGLAPGPHHGTLYIRCTTCPPPPVCVQNVMTVKVRLSIAAGSGEGVQLRQ